MNNQKIKTETLAPGKMILVRGNVNYSHITSRFEGEELLKRDADDRANGRRPKGKPYTTITIENPTVINQTANAPTLEEMHAAQNIYLRKKDGMPCYNAVSKSPIRLPFVAVMQPDGRTAQQIEPEGELANGLNVTLVVKTFLTNIPDNPIGIGLEGVLVNEPIRYYQRLSNADLSAYGITLTAAPQTAQEPVAKPEPAYTQPTVPQSVPAQPFMSPGVAPAQTAAAPVGQMPAITPVNPMANTNTGIVYQVENDPNRQY